MLGIEPAVANLAYNVAKDVKSAAKKTGGFSLVDSDEKLRSHVLNAYEWASKIQFFGMAKYLDTEVATVSLPISDKPRKFSAKGSVGGLLSEVDLLSQGSSTIILGDPGSGKTTTVKRLISRLVEQPPQKEGELDFPILVTAKDLKDGKSIYVFLAEIIGAEYTDWPRGEVWEKLSEFEKKAAIRARTTKCIELVQNFLSRARVLLIVDGLDEIEVDFRSQLFDDLEKLDRLMLQGKVIATCRSGEFVYLLEGFLIGEILPLSEAEIVSIIESWSADPQKFMQAIRSVHYKDLLSRPLFLCQIISLYDETGIMPRKAAQVYRLVTNLMLERWDFHRRINRTGRSSYAKLDLDEKIDILAALGFHLLFERKRKFFTSYDLVGSYIEICEEFGLKSSEKDDFVSDIESHTGLIVQTSIDEFGFSHFSLQEFLCAHFIVRQPSLHIAVNKFVSYREIVAIAVGLSSDADEYLLLLMCSLTGKEPSEDLHRALLGFLHRLKIEAPSFRFKSQMGLAFLVIIHLLWSSVDREEEQRHIWRDVVSLFGSKAMLEAIGRAMNYYVIEESECGKSICLIRGIHHASDISGLPERLDLPSDFHEIFT